MTNKLLVLCLGLSVTVLAQQNGPRPAPQAEAESTAGSRKFENPYLRIHLLPGWMVEASDDPTLNLVRGKYLLSINPIFTHASPISGGRFSEIVSAKQSIDAVMANVDQPADGSECTKTPSDMILVNENISLGNMYTDSSKAGHGCIFPSNRRSVWFGSVFSGAGSESDYTITLTYRSSRVDEFPPAESMELKQVFSEVGGLLNTLALKPPISNSKIDPSSAAPGTSVTIYGVGFNLFKQGVEVRFKEFPNNPLPKPVVASDGRSLTFQVPTSITTISCPAGHINVNEWCIPAPPNHVDIDDCPSTSNGSTNFCGKPIMPGTYSLWVTSGDVGTDFVSFTVTPAERRAVSITLVYPNTLVSAGDLITIHGSGFATNSNTVKLGSALVTDLPSSDGKTISLHAPAPAGVSFVSGIRIYMATVINTAGESNPISFGYQ